MPKVRSAVIWLFMAIEALITAPFFAVSWALSAVAFAVVAGFQFAKMDDDKARRKVLEAMLGGGVGK